ncbi:hypothetical protein EC968_003340 [Mortierella alpina]|nr:hypothetical protein EC968_003340 [Mortierella alpina]
MSLDTTAPSHSTARLSYNDFEVAIRAFLKQVEHHAPWSYFEYRNSSLSQPNSAHLKQSTGSHEVEPEDQLILDDLADHFGAIPDEYDDDALGAIELPDSTCADILTVSYHIIFSPSYQVPVLYFNAYRQG